MAVSWEDDVSIKKYMQERKQRKILQENLPDILDKIAKEHKILLSNNSVLSELRGGKLFGVAGTKEIDGQHLSYKFTCGIHKL